MTNQIKRTSSYGTYKDLYDWISEKKRSEMEILRKVHNIMDGWKAYKYRHISDCAERCIDFIEQEEDKKRELIREKIEAEKREDLDEVNCGYCGAREEEKCRCEYENSMLKGE